jgi:hypothetical protein
VKGNFPVLLDSCVLIPMPLADTLLRLAAVPRLYSPKWTDQIMAEVSRNYRRTSDLLQRKHSTGKVRFASISGSVGGWVRRADSGHDKS